MRIMKKVGALAVMLVCFLAMMLSGTVFAADGTAKAELTIEQVFQQPDSAENIDNRFQYKLTAKDPGNPMPAKSEITIDGTNEQNIDPITFTNTGIYEYEIKMAGFPDGSGYTLDKQVYKITIYVTRSGEELAAKVIFFNENNTKTTGLLFTHSYKFEAANPTLTVDPPVKKTVTGNPDKDSEFTFTLTAKDKKSPMPADSKDGVKTINITGSGEKDFGTWSYTEEGVYYYTIAEVNTGINGYTYDTSVYTITDTVKEANGKLELSRVVTNSANKRVDSCAFINKYVSGGGKPGDGPKTGDSMNPAALAVVISVFSVIAVSCVCYLLLNKKRKKKDNVNP